MTNTIPTHPTRPSKADLDAKGQRFAELQAIIAKAKAEMDDLKLEMSQWAIDKYLAGEDVQVSIQAWRKRDDVRFEEDHPFDLYPELYKFVLDTKAIDNEIAKVDLEPYMAQQTPKVLVKVLS